MKTDPYKQSGT